MNTGSDPCLPLTSLPKFGWHTPIRAVLKSIFVTMAASRKNDSSSDAGVESVPDAVAFEQTLEHMLVYEGFDNNSDVDAVGSDGFGDGGDVKVTSVVPVLVTVECIDDGVSAGGLGHDVAKKPPWATNPTKLVADAKNAFGEPRPLRLWSCCTGLWTEGKACEAFYLAIAGHQLVML